MRRVIESALTVFHSCADGHNHSCSLTRFFPSSTQCPSVIEALKASSVSFSECYALLNPSYLADVVPPSLPSKRNKPTWHLTDAALSNQVKIRSPATPKWQNYLLRKIILTYLPCQLLAFAKPDLACVLVTVLRLSTCNPNSTEILSARHRSLCFRMRHHVTILSALLEALIILLLSPHLCRGPMK